MSRGSHRSVPDLFFLCLGAAAFLFFGCSRNEVKPSGPAPKAPQNARTATPIPKTGSGMNQMTELEVPRTSAGAAQATAEAEATFSGEVKLAAGLGGHFSQGATLFIIARDPSDRTVPLAAVKLKPEAFPARFTITSTDSMTGAKLPGEVELLAKLSKSGVVSSSAPEDFEAMAVRAKSGTPVVLVLEKK